MPRNTVAGASLGVGHPDYVEDGPVPPVVPEGVPLDAPIDELVAAVEDAAPTVEVDEDGDGVDDVTKQPVKSTGRKASK